MKPSGGYCALNASSYYLTDECLNITVWLKLHIFLKDSDGSPPRIHWDLQNNIGIEKLIHTDFCMAHSSHEVFVTIIDQIWL